MGLSHVSEAEHIVVDGLHSTTFVKSASFVNNHKFNKQCYNDSPCSPVAYCDTIYEYCQEICNNSKTVSLTSLKFCIVNFTTGPYHIYSVQMFIIITMHTFLLSLQLHNVTLSLQLHNFSLSLQLHNFLLSLQQHNLSLRLHIFYYHCNYTIFHYH